VAQIYRNPWQQSKKAIRWFLQLVAANLVLLLKYFDSSRIHEKKNIP
jgi:hypothetical protein